MRICENCGQLLMGSPHNLNGGDTYRCKKKPEPELEEAFEEPSETDVSYSTRMLEAGVTNDAEPYEDETGALVCKHCGQPIESPFAVVGGSGLVRVYVHSDTMQSLCRSYKAAEPAVEDDQLPVVQISELARHTIISVVEEPSMLYIKFSPNKWSELDAHCMECGVDVDDEYFKGKKIEFHAIGVEKS